MTRVESVLTRLGIQATRQGREWVALCPNPKHEDHNPSWRIRDDPGGTKDGYHRCWACLFEGGLVGLVSQVLSLNTRDARMWLESEATAPPPAVSVDFIAQRSGQFEFPAGVEIAPLDKWPTPARRYAESRGITSDQVAKWGLGFALEGRLDGRIVIPVRDRWSTLAGYTARTFVDHHRRYLEPEAHERANRSVIFGEQYWTRGLVVVVEGALNGLAVERAYPDACIAAMHGSSLPPTASLKLLGFDDVIIATDPDAAGDKLARELEWILDRQGVTNYRLRFPMGQDADSLERAHLADLIDSAIALLR